MSVRGLLDAEKKANGLRRKLEKSLNSQLRELKQELSKVEFLLEDKTRTRQWANSSADLNRYASIRGLLDETEALYLEAGDSEAARIFKARMEKQLKKRLTNLKANELEVKARLEQFRAQTQPEMLRGLNDIRQDSVARELYAQSRQVGGFLSGVGRGYMKDLVTLETKAAGSKTIGEYMNNLYTQYENGLKDVFVKGIVRGDSYEKMVENLVHTTDITKGKARLLVRTEANAIFNESVREVIDDNPLVKGYRFRAVLDKRTSSTCQAMDGTYIPKDQVEPGVNFPPLHPNCRSTVTTVLATEDERVDIVQRYTKNGSNEWVPVPLGMTYPQFKERMQGFAQATPRPQRRENASYSSDITRIDTVLNSIRQKDSQVRRAEYASRDWQNQLNAKDKNIVTGYTTNQFRRINNELRVGVDEQFKAIENKDFKEDIRILSNALNKGGGLQEDLVVSRYATPEILQPLLGYGTLPQKESLSFYSMLAEENMSDKIQGMIILDRGFVSTTMASRSALIGVGGDSLEIRMMLPKGTPAKYIGSLSAFPQEREVLVDKSTPFEVLGFKREKQENKYILYARAIVEEKTKDGKNK